MSEQSEAGREGRLEAVDEDLAKGHTKTRGSSLLAPELLLVRPPAPGRHGEASAECRLSDRLHQLRLQIDGAQLHLAAGCVRLVGHLLRKERALVGTLDGLRWAGLAPIAAGTPGRWAEMGLRSAHPSGFESRPGHSEDAAISVA